jgi:hypothetical protein
VAACNGGHDSGAVASSGPANHPAVRRIHRPPDPAATQGDRDAFQPNPRSSRSVVSIRVSKISLADGMEGVSCETMRNALALRGSRLPRPRLATCRTRSLR